jgi:hypothetical protein
VTEDDYVLISRLVRLRIAADCLDLAIPNAPTDDQAKLKQALQLIWEVATRDHARVDIRPASDED